MVGFVAQNVLSAGRQVPIKNSWIRWRPAKLERFLDDFEGVSREEAEALLELACSHLLEDLL